ncbi:Hypothetical predicted protein, partial [Paramuricea clavata]
VQPFSGDATGYREFRKLFDALVHQRPGLSTVAKLAYLKQSLTGRALELARTYEFSEENYTKILAALDDEYGLEWVTKMQCFESLAKLPQVDSIHSPSLKVLYNTVLAVMNTLQGCGHVLEVNPDQPIFVILVRLPPQLRTEWNRLQRREKYKDNDRLREFLAFLRDYAQSTGDTRTQNAIA